MEENWRNKRVIVNDINLNKFLCYIYARMSSCLLFVFIWAFFSLISIVVMYFLNNNKLIFFMSWFNLAMTGTFSLMSNFKYLELKKIIIKLEKKFGKEKISAMIIQIKKEILNGNKNVFD